MASETVTCICDKVVRTRETSSVSGYEDRWDLRTKTVKFYCKDSPQCKRVALEWLMRPRKGSK